MRNKDDILKESSGPVLTERDKFMGNKGILEVLLDIRDLLELIKFK